ncbi:MAG: acyltransferase [Acidimicrobiales bacterium]|nr:acyltransferase [Acidimicrobiales bacterium]
MTESPGDPPDEVGAPERSPVGLAQSIDDGSAHPLATVDLDTAVVRPSGSATVAERTPFRLGSRPPLTGVRAFLIALVIAYHSNFHTIPGSWATMQMFFVLSGFLITAMLDGEGKRNGKISLSRFYSRRAVRLFPPLVLVVALLAIYGALVSVADASQRIWGDSAAALFYYADYRQAFGHAPFFGFLAQTWSLSVEEQFYVIWSILMVAAVASGHRRLAYVFAAGGIAASVADRLYLSVHPAHFSGAVFDRVYYAFDSRADALLLGCLLGLLASDGHLSDWGRSAKRLLSAAAVLSVVLMVWILAYAPLFREALAVWQLPASTLACAVIIVYFVVCPSGLGSRLAGLGLFVFVGDLSYTLYVAHFGVFLAIQPNSTGWGFWPTELVRLAVVFAIAIFSWFLIERPLMRWRQRSAAR